MKIGIVQPYFFPYIGYFQLIHAVDKFVVYDDVNFMKKKWINRNQILVAGKPSFITVPLKKASQNKLILETQIIDDNKWKFKMLKNVKSAYGRAPMFNSAFTLVESVLNRSQIDINQLALDSIKSVCQYLDVNTHFINSSTRYQNAQLKSQDRILDICIREQANCYLNPIGGINLYSKEAFMEKNIRLNFVQPFANKYQQFGGSFVPFLSIIDVLMFNPKETIKKYLNQCKLI